jgi:hypothetical protein
MSKPNPLGRWLFAGVAGAAAYTLFVRPWHLHWGATDEEVKCPLPGDNFVALPRIAATHAVTIHVPAAEVWPWLVQIGRGRGGFYSYTWIENLMGLDIHNEDRIVPAFQELRVGDVIPFDATGFGVPVAILEPTRTLVLHGDTRTAPAGEAPVVKPGEFLSVSWGFYLEAIEPQTTRLIERFRADFSPTLPNTLFYRGFLEPGAFIMERRMLLGIKERAEKLRAMAN